MIDSGYLLEDKLKHDFLGVQFNQSHKQPQCHDTQLQRTNVPSQPARCNSYRTPQCHDTQLQHTNVPSQPARCNSYRTPQCHIVRQHIAHIQQWQDGLHAVSEKMSDSIQFARLYQILLHAATLECKTSIGNMSDRLSVCLSVHLSVTRWYCLKTYKLKIMWFSPSCSPGTLVSSDQLRYQAQVSEEPACQGFKQD